HHAVHEAPLPCLLGGVAPAVHDDLLGTGGTDHADEAGRGGHAQRNTEVDLGDPQLRLGRRDAEVAGQREAPAAADGVTVENFVPGVAERLGVGYTAISATNPAIVYASVSGYGQDGP